ncbi:MAG: D-alanine--D-alanine ligase, partial [Gemmatimonadetes bacterium]|nr:D-alanine--D-alanine ligase [Gemmatimonadota bacterium]
SVRLTLARSIEEVGAGAARAAEGGDRVLYEAYVEGREFTVGVLGDEALPVVEIEPAHDFFDFECKYEPGLATETAPAEIPGSLAETLQEAALLAHRLLRLEHFSRIDFIVDRSGRPWCLEANALPGLTANSLVPKSALAAGLDFPELCERICNMGRERAERMRPPSTPIAAA